MKIVNREICNECSENSHIADIDIMKEGSMDMSCHECNENVMRMDIWWTY